jgi:hypothetical protein
LAASTARILPERAVRAVARLSSRAQSFGADGSETELALLERVTNPAVRNPLVGKLAFDRLLRALHVGRRESKVLFVFTAISHPPWNFTEDGIFEIGAGPMPSSIFFARSIVHLVDRLRELAALDDSLVVVASDHGTLPILDASMGGVFAPEHRLPRELNALVMVKPPHADQPLRISKMTVWLGDIAATVRDALDLPQPANPSFESRSLLLPDNPDRVLALPVFFRPDQVSYHAVLKKWVRVDVRGTFAEFGKAASLDPRALLSRRASIVLRTGTDTYATQLAAQGLMDGEGTISSSWIEIDGRRIGKVMNDGVVTLSDETGQFRIRQVQGAQAGSVSLSSTESARNHFAAAVGIPRRLVPRHLADTRPAAKDDELLNCVLVASERSRPRTASRCSPGDIALEVEWP